jgi:hypothetical protein
VIFSKLRTGNWPQISKVVQKINRMLQTNYKLNQVEDQQKNLSSSKANDMADSQDGFRTHRSKLNK